MNIKPAFIRLPHKSSAAIAYHYFPPSPSPSSTGKTNRLLVFCNGMIGHQMTWMPTIRSLLSKLPEQAFGIMTYDRYGQAMTTDRDPGDAAPGKEAGLGHDLNDVVGDLTALLTAIGEEHHLKDPELVLVGNSIGCAIARHWADQNPGRVVGLLLLDSILANSDFHNDVFPDPDSPSYDAKALPGGLSEPELRKAREISFKIFSPSQPNGEGFDRRNMATLLPHADKPRLVGPNGKGPYLTVVGHEPKKFADGSKERMGMSEVATYHYVQPYWEAYNQGLLEISDRGEGRVLIAEGCGHVIHLDAPDLVAGHLEDVLKAIDWA